MSQTFMHVRNFLATAPFLPADQSVMMRGPHGVGKSQIARQIAEIIKKNEGLEEFEVIDRRLSQQTEGDMIGLPSTNGEVTRFNPPDWYHKACKKPCFLLLDELNRATNEVMQAAFQIVLDRELNGHKLHPQTRVYTAVNTGGQYSVNEIDPALLDRFWCVDLSPDTQDWLAWATSEGKICDTVVDFIRANEKFLHPVKNHDPGSVQPSPRSWERLSRALVSAKVQDKPVESVFYQLSLGFIGIEPTIAFCDFAKNTASHVTGEDIIDKFGTKEIKARVDKLSTDRLNGVIEKAIEYVATFTKPLTKNQQKNLKDFMESLVPELRIKLFSGVMQAHTSRTDVMKSIHAATVEQIVTGVFGVTVGQAGVGQTPKIPGFLQPKDKDKK